MVGKNRNLNGCLLWERNMYAKYDINRVYSFEYVLISPLCLEKAAAPRHRLPFSVIIIPVLSGRLIRENNIHAKFRVYKYGNFGAIVISQLKLCIFTYID